MSHFSRITTIMKNEEYLKQGLTDLGYSFEEGALEVRGHGGLREKVEIKVKTGKSGRAIGFKKRDGKYILIADWSEIRGIDRQKFLNQVQQRYAYHTTIEKLREQGYSVVSEEVSSANEVHLILQRIA